MSKLSFEEVNALAGKVFAPWVRELGLEPVSYDGKGGNFRLPDDRALVHIGNVVCGQAIAAAADTAIVYVLTALNGRMRMFTTVDFTTHFLRPIPPGACDIRVEVLSNGKRMAYLRVDFRAAGSEKLAATVTSAFAYLED